MTRMEVAMMKIRMKKMVRKLRKILARPWKVMLRMSVMQHKQK
jgi:hypothetical protein